jgi:hypothetical protein
VSTLSLRAERSALQASIIPPAVIIAPQAHGVLFLRKQTIPGCWHPDPVRRNVNRTRLRDKQTKTLEEQGKILEGVLWRDDGAGINWKRVTSPSLSKDPTPSSVEMKTTSAQPVLPTSARESAARPTSPPPSVPPRQESPAPPLPHVQPQPAALTTVDSTALKHPVPPKPTGMERASWQTEAARQVIHSSQPGPSPAGPALINPHPNAKPPEAGSREILHPWPAAYAEPSARIYQNYAYVCWRRDIHAKASGPTDSEGRTTRIVRLTNTDGGLLVEDSPLPPGKQGTVLKKPLQRNPTENFTDSRLSPGGPTLPLPARVRHLLPREEAPKPAPNVKTATASANDRQTKPSTQSQAYAPPPKPVQARPAKPIPKTDPPPAPASAKPKPVPPSSAKPKPTPVQRSAPPVATKSSKRERAASPAASATGSAKSKKNKKAKKAPKATQSNAEPPIAPSQHTRFSDSPFGTAASAGPSTRADRVQSSTPFIPSPIPDRSDHATSPHLQHLQEELKDTAARIKRFRTMIRSCGDPDVGETLVAECDHLQDKMIRLDDAVAAERSRLEQ